MTVLLTAAIIYLPLSFNFCNAGYIQGSGALDAVIMSLKSQRPSIFGTGGSSFGKRGFFDC